MGTTTAFLHKGGKVSDSQTELKTFKEQTEQIQADGLVSYSGPQLVQQQNH